MQSPPTAERSDFFVSYTGVDVEWATWIAGELRSDGFTVVMQRSDFRASANFVRRMNEELERTDRVLAVASRAYFASDYTNLEWTAALALDQGRGSRLLVVRVQDVALPPLLGPLVHVDLFASPSDAARDALLAGVRGTPHVGAPSTLPAARPMGRELSPIWNVPLRPLPRFIGRDVELTRIRRSLAEAPSPGIVALVGMGGVGKTRLAAEYAYAHASEFDLVWWLPGSPNTSTAVSFAQLGAELELPELSDLAPQAVAFAVRRALEQRDRWLLIVDDVQADSTILDLLPRGGDGAVLVTSRDIAWSEHAATVRLGVLERAHSTALLLAQSGQDSGFAASRLAESLGDLPLALRQAAAYMAATGESPEAYLELLHSQTGVILAASAPSDYRGSAATAWSISLQAIARESPDALALLGVLAFLAPHPVPREAFAMASHALPDSLQRLTAERARLNESVTALGRFALVEIGTGLSCHRLIQAAVREALSVEETRSFVAAAVSVVRESFPSSVHEPVSFRAGALLLPHAASVSGYALALAVATREAAELLLSVSGHLSYSVSPLAGIPPLEQALALLEQDPQPDLLRPAVISSTGHLFHLLGDFPAAIRYLSEAAEMWPAGNLSRQVQLTDLSHALRQGHHLREAETVARQALDETPSDSPRLAYRLNMLALALQEQGQLVEAQQLLERALPLCVGEAAGLVGAIHNNLGLVLRKRGDFEAARAEVELGVAFVARQYGERHWGMVKTLQNLGRVEAAASNPAEAVRIFELALEIASITLPPEHPWAMDVEADRRSAIADAA